MRRILGLGLVAAGLVLAAGTVGATTIAVESFNLTPGDLNGQSGGLGSTGWAGAWTAGTAYENVVSLQAPAATPLSYSASGWTLNGGNPALQIAGGLDSTQLAYRSLTANQSGDVWVSFMMRWNAGAVDQNDALLLWFDNTAAGDHSLVPNIGFKGNEGDSGPGGVKEDFVVRLIMGANDDYAGNITVPDPAATHLVVGHLVRGATKYNVFEMWVDPNATNLVGDASANHFVYAVDNTGNTGLTSFNTIGLRSANLDSNDVILIDELRLGTTMLDVLNYGSGGLPPVVTEATIPEPVTMAGLFLGLTGLGGYIRKRRAA